MTQRRWKGMRLVVSNRVWKSTLPQQRKLPIGFSNSSPNIAGLRRKVTELCRLEPAYGDVLEKLVSRQLEKLKKTGSIVLLLCFTL